VLTFRGSKIDRIADELMKRDLSSYKNIILQVGGNHIASDGSLRNFEEDYESLLHAARAFVKKGCQIIVSGLLPRSDVCVHDANIVLENLCNFLCIMFIPPFVTFTTLYTIANN